MLVFSLRQFPLLASIVRIFCAVRSKAVSVWLQRIYLLLFRFYYPIEMNDPGVCFFKRLG